jgi:hypothetical protein
MTPAGAQAVLQQALGIYRLPRDALVIENTSRTHKKNSATLKERNRHMGKNNVNCHSACEPFPA